MKKLFALMVIAGITTAVNADYYRGGSCSAGHSGSYGQVYAPSDGYYVQGGTRYQQPADGRWMQGRYNQPTTDSRWLGDGRYNQPGTRADGPYIGTDGRYNQPSTSYDGRWFGGDGRYNQPRGDSRYYRQNGYYQEPGSDAQKQMYQDITARTEKDKVVYKNLRDALSRYENVNISVNNGDVTLRGFVNSQSERKNIEDKVQGIDGVRNVINNIKVKGDSNGNAKDWNRDSRNLRDSWDHDMNNNN